MGSTEDPRRDPLSPDTSNMPRPHAQPATTSPPVGERELPDGPTPGTTRRDPGDEHTDNPAGG